MVYLVVLSQGVNRPHNTHLGTLLGNVCNEVGYPVEACRDINLVSVP